MLLQQNYLLIIWQCVLFFCIISERGNKKSRKKKIISFIKIVYCWKIHSDKNNLRVENIIDKKKSDNF